jgi:hypothetical protein
MEIKLEKEKGNIYSSEVRKQLNIYIFEKKILMDHDRDHEAMEELVRGREYANKLGQVLAVMKINNHDDELAAAAATATPLFAQHLVNNILNSFTNTLFLLKKNQMQLKRDFSFISPTKSEDNTQDTSTGAAAGGRGSYKRR